MSKNISKKTSLTNQSISFTSSNHRAKWAHELFNKSRITHQLLTSNINETSLKNLIAKLYQSEITDKSDFNIVLQMYKQQYSELLNQQATTMGYESNFTGVNNFYDLSKNEQKAYLKGAKMYRSDTIQPKVKEKIQKGILK